MLSVSCPYCRKTLKGKDSLAGSRVICPACKTEFEIPLPAIPVNQPESESDPLDFLNPTQKTPSYPPPPKAQPGQPSKQHPRDEFIDALRTSVTRWHKARVRSWASLDRRLRLLVVCGGFFMLALLVLVVAKHKSVPPIPQTNPTTKTIAIESTDAGKNQKDKSQERPVSISAYYLWSQYYTNALAADAKFKNKEVIVSSSVRLIGKVNDGRYYIRFSLGTAGPPNVICYLAKDSQHDFDDFTGDKLFNVIWVHAKVIGLKQTNNVLESDYPDRYVVELEDGKLVR